MFAIKVLWLIWKYKVFYLSAVFKSLKTKQLMKSKFRDTNVEINYLFLSMLNFSRNLDEYKRKQHQTWSRDGKNIIVMNEVIRGIPRVCDAPENVVK